VFFILFYFIFYLFCDCFFSFKRQAAAQPPPPFSKWTKPNLPIISPAGLEQGSGLINDEKQPILDKGLFIYFFLTF
jgi:hypothetical protein